MSKNLLIVGAYPANNGKYDEPEHQEALASVARVRVPRADPVYGKDGPSSAYAGPLEAKYGLPSKRAPRVEQTNLSTG